ncbi:RAMP superfamily CRISPR-associated protein [Lamprobacter modestohalophilus]|uniref:RAMP superfamily CRISPR-associated protein n=1 Tax=Lamprobacter modestohalophilus TaxID=1064514 RepID=UPI002ADEB2A8|nr:RAMP superfamily CRISPR-associated protein [Lamprobacter modestohalophilus]MEA1051763.1 RAMP superfamily CRISPR-associated protein [Lamprobacter modestohalophilus]
MSEHRHDVRQLAITALSPVHIGTGEDLEPTGYVIEGEDLYRFSPEAALRALPAAAREELTKVLGAAPSVQLIKQVQAFFHRHCEALIAEAEHAMPVLPSIAAEYQQRVGKTAQREENGREIINQLAIARTYADVASGRPILPGSSLKGAMRTALLDLVNDGKSLQKRRESNRDLQQRLFRYKQFDLDPMRLVQIGDARDLSPDETYATEVRYAVNRKRQPVLKDGREIPAQAENLRQVLECVPPLRPQAFIGQLGIQDVAGLSSPKLPDARLRWSFADIAAACNQFYQPILEREVLELRSRGYLSATWVDAVQQLLTDRQSALQTNQAFLLRVGRHSGAESVTLNGVRSIKIMGAKGERPTFMEAAKTVWLAAGDIQQRAELLPFGWVLVESAPVGQPLPSWPAALREGLAEQAGIASNHWYQRTSERRAALRTLAAERKARERQRAEEAAREAQAEQAKAERLANLSAEALKLEELRERLDQDRAAGRKEKGGELANQLLEVLKVAEQQWSGPVCSELADLAEEIHGFIGWPAKQKKQARKDLIAAIRAKA